MTKCFWLWFPLFFFIKGFKNCFLLLIRDGSNKWRLLKVTSEPRKIASLFSKFHLLLWKDQKEKLRTSKVTDLWRRNPFTRRVTDPSLACLSSFLEWVRIPGLYHQAGPMTLSCSMEELPTFSFCDITWTRPSIRGGFNGLCGQRVLNEFMCSRIEEEVDVSHEGLCTVIWVKHCSSSFPLLENQDKPCLMFPKGRNLWLLLNTSLAYAKTG